MDRRTFVGGASIFVTAGLAGCVGDSLELGSGNTPEAATEAFFQAFADGDTERQAELLHEEATGFQPNSDELELTINEIESRTIEEIAEEQGQSVTEDELEDAREQLEERFTEIGVDDATHVYFDIEDDEHGSENGYLFLVEDDGEWLIYSVGVGVEPQQAEATGQETQHEISNRLHIVSMTGTVTEHETINEVIIEVTRSPGSEDIDLEEVSYQFDAGDTDVLTADEISVISAETDDNVITDQADRYELSFETTSHLDSELEAGEKVSIQLTTPSGGMTPRRLEVPEDLDGQSTVSL